MNWYWYVIGAFALLVTFLVTGIVRYVLSQKQDGAVPETQAKAGEPTPHSPSPQPPNTPSSKKKVTKNATDWHLLSVGAVWILGIVLVLIISFKILKKLLDQMEGNVRSTPLPSIGQDHNWLMTSVIAAIIIFIAYLVLRQLSKKKDDANTKDKDGGKKDDKKQVSVGANISSIILGFFDCLTKFAWPICLCLIAIGLYALTLDSFKEGKAQTKTIVPSGLETKKVTIFVRAGEECPPLPISCPNDPSMKLNVECDTNIWLRALDGGMFEEVSEISRPRRPDGNRDREYTFKAVYDCKRTHWYSSDNSGR